MEMECSTVVITTYYTGCFLFFSAAENQLNLVSLVKHLNTKAKSDHAPQGKLEYQQYYIQPPNPIRDPPTSHN